MPKLNYEAMNGMLKAYYGTDDLNPLPKKKKMTWDEINARMQEIEDERTENSIAGALRAIERYKDLIIKLMQEKVKEEC